MTTSVESTDPFRSNYAVVPVATTKATGESPAKIELGKGAAYVDGLRCISNGRAHASPQRISLR